MTARTENSDGRITPIKWSDSSLRILDQRELPFRTVFIDAMDYHEVVGAITSLAIRGAPLIGIAAAYGVALASTHIQTKNITSFRDELLRVCDEFASSRPTAVNLFWALEKARALICRERQPDVLRDRLISLAIAIHSDDERRCTLIGAHGAELLRSGGSVITHCNTGMLATGGDGTAFNVIRIAHQQYGNLHVYVDETRPLLQGTRLTTWELLQHGIPFTLITDSTAPFVMQQKNILAVVTGADRIARNGDTANKIGTYGLALAAHTHRIPFYIAAPLSTVDMKISSGREIPIEERYASEVLAFHSLQIAPTDTPVYSPAFDITPFHLISAVITEADILYPPFEEKFSLLLPS